MTKVKDKLTREKAITEIYLTEKQIDETLIKISFDLNNFPDTWINSVNKNYAAFLGYCQGLMEKYNEEIKPEINKNK